MKWSYQAMKRLYQAMKRSYRGLKRNNYLVREVFFSDIIIIFAYYH